MMAFLGRRPVEGELAGLFFDDLQFDGGDNGEISWGDEITESEKAASPVVVIGCGMGGILAGIRLASRPDCPSPSSTRTRAPAAPGGRTTTPAHASTSGAISTASPSSRPSCGASTTASSRSCAPTSAASSTSSTSRAALPLRDGGHGGGLAGGPGHVARHDARANGGEEVLEARFVISAVGSLNLPRLPEIPGMETFAGPSFHSARWPEDLDIGGTNFALVGAGASGFQIGPAIADEVDQLTVFQRTAQWILPNRLYHTSVPPGDAWALKHLPFYGRWYRFVMTYAGIAAGMEMYRIDPEYDDPTHQSINPLNAAAGDVAGGLDALTASATTPSCSRRSFPTIPPRASASSRTTAPGCAPAEAQRRAGADRHRAGGPRRHRHDRRHALPGRRHLLRHRVPAQRVPGVHGRSRAGWRLVARAVGRRAHGVPRHHDAELPQPLLHRTARERTWPSAPASSTTPSSRCTMRSRPSARR